MCTFFSARELKRRILAKLPSLEVCVTSTRGTTNAAAHLFGRTGLYAILLRHAQSLGEPRHVAYNTHRYLPHLLPLPISSRRPVCNTCSRPLGTEHKFPVHKMKMARRTLQQKWNEKKDGRAFLGEALRDRQSVIPEPWRVLQSFRAPFHRGWN